MSRLEKNPLLGITAGTGTLASVAAAGVLLASYFGGGLLQQETEPAAVESTTESASLPWTDNPAEKLLASALSKAPGGWKTNGDVQRGVTAPFPYSCPQEGLAPSVSLSRSFTANGTRIQVVAAAYTAGLGAEAMEAQVDNAYRCAGSDAWLSVGTLTEGKPGVEAYQSVSSRAGATTQVIASRRGDVITWVTGPSGAPLQAHAATFDAALAGPLAEVCASPESKAADGTRSPWSPSGFKPYTVGRTAQIEEVPKPRLPKDSAAKAVDLPGDTIRLEEAVPADRPDYPVWPDMPETMELPEVPKSPAKAATLESTYRELATDETGPGCGWAFTGMKAPVFDAAKAAGTNAKKRTDAIQALEKNAAKWAKSVVAYWENYAEYREATEDYKEYAAEVAKTNEAWAEIAKDWDRYRAELQEYDTAVASREEFTEAKAAAKDAYEDELKVCADRKETAKSEAEAEAAARKAAEKAKEEAAAQERADADNGPEKPKPGVEASAKPEEPAAAEEDCDPERPAILDEDAPEVPQKPKEPADPRPASER